MVAEWSKIFDCLWWELLNFTWVLSVVLFMR